MAPVFKRHWRARARFASFPESARCIIIENQKKKKKNRVEIERTAGSGRRDHLPGTYTTSWSPSVACRSAPTSGTLPRRDDPLGAVRWRVVLGSTRVLGRLYTDTDDDAPFERLNTRAHILAHTHTQTLPHEHSLANARTHTHTHKRARTQSRWYTCKHKPHTGKKYY